MTALNVLPELPSTPPLVIFLHQFKSTVVALLLLAAGVSLLLGEPLDAAFILLIVSANAAIGFYQEMKAKNEIAALKKLVVQTARVIRHGQELLLETKFITVGDLVVLSEGDKIPADGFLLEAKNATVNEAALTGESVPVEKSPKDEVFLGTIVLSGRGKMQVTKIGAETKFGQIALSLAQIPEEPTPLEIKLADLGKKITAGILLLLFALGVVSLAQSRNLQDLLLSSIALAVSAVPEGLPAVLTIAMAVGVRRLASRKAIVKRLLATETLGSVDVILCDKTGTLTKNEMTVKEILTARRQRHLVSGTGFNTNGTITSSKDRDLNALILAGVLCNASSLAPVEDHDQNYLVLGDTTEGALLIAAKKAGLDPEELRKANPIFEEIPFDSDRKMMTVLAGKKVYAKGAPEKILELCTNLSARDKNYFLAQTTKLAAQGYRLLALAQKESNRRTNLEKDLDFLGLVALLDPPRPEAKESLRLCQEMGISAVMVTGDLSATAQAVAKSIGLLTPGREIVTGEQLNKYSDEVLTTNLLKIGVFARATPGDKLRIVTAYQKIGRVVAVTGDGVNDAPALKKAQVGVAMGITGTAVAHEAADLIITDDNFATIVAAVEEGRTIFANLSKAIKYLLACNLGEVTTVSIAVVFGLPVPLSPVAILWTNVVTDGLPALALAIDPKEEKSPAHSLQQSLLGSANLQFIVSTGLLLGITALGLFALLPTNDQETARLTTFNFLVLGQIVVAFLVRGRSQKILGNKALLLAAALAIFFQAVIVSTPAIRERFL